MRCLHVLLVLCGMVAAVCAGAQNVPPGGPAPCPLPNDPVAQIEILFPVVDLNHDNAISLGEAQVFYAGLTQDLFDIADMDRSGGVTKEELLPLLPLLPVDYVSYVDPNHDGLVAYPEVSAYLTLDQFQALDKNRNQYIDCGDFPPAGEGEGEGEGEGQTTVDCGLVSFFANFFDGMDVNADQVVTEKEFLAQVNVLMIPLDITPVFGMADTNQDKQVTRDELNALLGQCNLPGEGEGEGEGEGDPAIDPCKYAQFFDTAFQRADTDGNGHLTLAELSALLALLDAVYPDMEPYFHAIDFDNSGDISRDELIQLLMLCGNVGGEGEGEGEGQPPVDPCVFIQYFGPDAWPLFDSNNDGKLSFAELPPIDFFVAPDVTPEQAFQLADHNADSFVDAQEFAVLRQYCVQPGGEGEGEGEGEGQPDPNSGDCQLVQMAIQVFPLLDANHDGKITMDELDAYAAQMNFVLPDGTALFIRVDTNNDGAMSLEELHTAVRLLCGGTPGGEGEGEGEGQPQPGQGPLQLIQGVGGNGFYSPGGTVLITEDILQTAPADVSALGLSIALPDGWTVAGTINAGGTATQPGIGQGGTVEFAWVDVPRFPERLSFAVTVPANEVGLQMVVAKLIYRLGTENGEQSVSTATAIGAGYSREHCHSADRDQDWAISLSEALRLVQLFNVGSYHCEDGSEDGYAPGPGAQGCAPHETDYNNQDWRISLSELLRLVQMYNSGSYFVEAGTEDGFAAGHFVLK